MHGSYIQAVQIVFLLLLTFVVAFGVLARKLQVPYPIVLVIGGLILSFIPGIPHISLDPDLIFFVVLPPLLYSAAWVISWREFSYNLVSITSLAIGLVSFTVAGVSFAASRFLPDFDWRSGWVLGAVVAPTDAVAASSIARRLGLPRRVTDLLEGESLVNDATGLLALEFGAAMIVRGQTPTAGQGLLRMLYLIVAGIVVGLVVSKFVEWMERRIDHGPIEVSISILVPYAAYLAAETVRASGALAVVTCGLYLSRKSSRFFSPNVRLQAFAVWDSITFILNGLVFVILGLQLPYVLAGIHALELKELLVSAALFSALVILLRLLWVFPAARVSTWIRRTFLHQDMHTPPDRQLFIVGWTGMRGVVSLAAALSLPRTLPSGGAFPHRNLIVFLTFSVILVTLVLQGLTLPRLIRALGLSGKGGDEPEEKEARRTILKAALDELEQLRRRDEPRFREVYDDLSHHYRGRLAALGQQDGMEEDQDGGEFYARHLDQSRRLAARERQIAVQLRNEGRISDDVLRRIEEELDLEETRMDRIQGNYGEVD